MVTGWGSCRLTHLTVCKASINYTQQYTQQIELVTLQALAIQYDKTIVSRQNYFLCQKLRVSLLIYQIKTVHKLQGLVQQCVTCNLNYLPLNRLPLFHHIQLYAVQKILNVNASGFSGDTFTTTLIGKPTALASTIAVYRWMIFASSKFLTLLKYGEGDKQILASF